MKFKTTISITARSGRGVEMEFEEMRNIFMGAIDRRLKKALINTSIEPSITKLTSDVDRGTRLLLSADIELIVNPQKLRKILTQAAAQELLF